MLIGDPRILYRTNLVYLLPSSSMDPRLLLLTVAFGPGGCRVLKPEQATSTELLVPVYRIQSRLMHTSQPRISL